MLNALILNTAMMNTGTPTPFAVTASDYDNLEYNGYSLQDGDTISSIIDAFSTPSRELVTFKVPRADGEGWNGDYFRERRIKVSGIIEAATSSLLETELDSFKMSMCAQQGLLALKINGEIREIVANLEKPEEMFGRREGYHITFTPFDLAFLAIEPMWHSLDYQSQTFEDVTSLAYIDAIEVTGTYKAQPVIVIIVQAATAITGIAFSNTTNGDEISITETIAINDVIVIDSEQKSLTLNGVEVAYDGIFPELDIGSNDITITSTGTSIEYTATIKYRKTYL